MNLRRAADAFDFGVRDWLGEIATKGLPGNYPMNGLPTPSGMVHPGYGGAGGGSWRTLLPGTNFDHEAAAGDLWRNSAVMACLRVLADNFAEPRLEVAVQKPDGTADVVVDADLVKLIARPNPHYDHYTLWEATALSLECDGNAYWFKVRSASMKVVQLWYIPHFMLEPLWPSDGSEYISAWLYTVNGRRFVIHKDDVVHFRLGIDPRNDRKGLSRLKQAVREIAGDNTAATYTAALVKTGIPAVVITPSEPGQSFRDQDEVEDIKGQFAENYSMDGAGKPLVTSTVKVERIGFSPEEMSLGELPDRFEDRISAVIGVPAQMTGLSSGADHKTYENYGQARRAFYEDKLIPLQKRIASTLTAQLLEADFSAPKGAFVRWDYRGVQCLAENLNDIAERVGLLYQERQVITRKEAREALNYPTKPEDDVFYDETKPDPPDPLGGSGGVAKPAPDAEDDDEPEAVKDAWRRLEQLGERRAA